LSFTQGPKAAQKAFGDHLFGILSDDKVAASDAIDGVDMSPKQCFERPAISEFREPRHQLLIVLYLHG
jgi:hypothetical protein